MDSIARAMAFGESAHQGQKRKYTHDDYWVHPMAVAQLVKDKGGSDIMIIAALLHDTVEDTATTLNDVKDYFGFFVATLVEELTDVYTHEAYPDWNRAKRKSAEADRLATISDEAKLIKWCDLADNTRSIVEHDPGFAAVYLREKAELIEKMGLDKLNEVC